MPHSDGLNHSVCGARARGASRVDARVSSGGRNVVTGGMNMLAYATVGLGDRTLGFITRAA